MHLVSSGELLQSWVFGVHPEGAHLLETPLWTPRIWPIGYPAVSWKWHEILCKSLLFGSNYDSWPLICISLRIFLKTDPPRLFTTWLAWSLQQQPSCLVFLLYIFVPVVSFYLADTNFSDSLVTWLRLLVWLLTIINVITVLWIGFCHTVWRLIENIIGTALCWVVWHNVRSAAHLYMSSSCRSSRLGLSHWDPYAVRRGGCVELCYCNTMEWCWWDSSLIWKTNWFPSVLWHCWFGRMTCKNCLEITYNVLSGTLSLYTTTTATTTTTTTATLGPLHCIGVATGCTPGREQKMGA